MQRFERFVEVDAPVERVFDLFADFEGFPRWMGNVRDVRRTGRRTSRWVAWTALGEDVIWDAETTVFEPDRRLVWRSVRGDVRTDGEAVFEQTPRGTTLVRVITGYDTPGGRTGADAARFFGQHPARQLEEDLARFRRLAERGGGGRRREAERRGAFERGGGRERRERFEFRERAPASEREARRGRSEGDAPRARHALTPREREREREMARERERGREAAREREREELERVMAGWYLRRGVDRLLEEPPPPPRGNWRRR